MAVVSYRIRCDSCPQQTVVRDDKIEESLWKVNSKTSHSGVCPDCNPSVAEDDIEDAREGREDDDEAVEFSKIDGVGDGAASSLRRSGVRTRGDVRRYSVEKLCSANGVGRGKAESIKEYVRNL